MAKKVALVTGANRGIGFETARQLGKLGYTILVGARNGKAGKEAADKLKKEEIDAQWLSLEPTDVDSVKQAVQTVQNQFGMLDVLVNNAGVLLEDDKNPAHKVATQTLRDTYEVNVFAVHQMIASFWELLNKSSGARVVNVSSSLGSLELHTNGTFGDFKFLAYDSSKAAVNMLTTHYAHEWKDTVHRINAIHPGSVKTEMNPNGELPVEDGAKTSVRLATIDSNGPNGGFFYMSETVPW